MNNWKTTICGLALAMIPAIEGYQGHDWKGYVSACLIAGFGFLAKDFNTTGGSNQAIDKNGAPMTPPGPPPALSMKAPN